MSSYLAFLENTLTFWDGSWTRGHSAAEAKLEGMLKPLTAAIVVFAAGCNHATLDEDIVGQWESSGTPASTALPDALRNSANWSAVIDFRADGTLDWALDNDVGGQDRYTGKYMVVGYSLEIDLLEREGLRLVPPLKYTVRQQSTGAIRLPLPQDWTGPSVDYFKGD